MSACVVEQLLPTGYRQSDVGGKLVARGDRDHSGFRWHFGHTKSLTVHIYRSRAASDAFDDVTDIGIAGILDGDDISGVKERLRRQMQAMLRPGGDEHLVGARPDASRRQHGRTQMFHQERIVG